MVNHGIFYIHLDLKCFTRVKPPQIKRDTIKTKIPNVIKMLGQTIAKTIPPFFVLVKIIISDC